MSTSKTNKQPKSSQTRNLKIQPKYRINRWSTTMVPEIKLCGNWLEQLGFTVDTRVTIHTSKELIVIRPQVSEGQ